MFRIAAFSLVLFLAGCATSELFWKFPPGGNQQAFQKDEYVCLQESQQQSSNANVNAFGGTAQSGSVTNHGLYQACMRARGYVSVAKGAVAEPIKKEPFPEGMYEELARQEVKANACAASSSISQEDLKLLRVASDSLLANTIVDRQKLEEARNSQRGYVTTPQDCGKLLNYINKLREIEMSRGR